MQPKNSSVLTAPPDLSQRIAALDPQRSVLVQAPAGSGKTDLLTRRFLSLLAEVDDPAQVVAITFTRAAAAEMRIRILTELEKAAARNATAQTLDEFSMEALAARALVHSRQRDWRLLELTSQLKISTIDSFCRELALRQPIYSGIGNSLQINERPTDLYRLAARATLDKLGHAAHPALSRAIQDLLLWRDNNWKELEDLLVKMLGQRDRWMHKFVLTQDPDWNAIRAWLEKPFSNAVQAAIENLDRLLDEVTGARDEALLLAQFTCTHGASEIHRELAELAEFPNGPYDDAIALENARSAYVCLSKMVLKVDGAFRSRVNKLLGFPKEHREEKMRMEVLIDQLSSVPGLEEALAAAQKLPPARYSEEDWQIIRASFTLLRHAVGELKAAFADAGTVDFIEVAQIARHVLRDQDQQPSDAAIAAADDIRHLLVDEFQDTSRRQHEFISALIAAWPDRARRTIFVVGDPMQSIYAFRDAEAELFGRVRERGFEFLQDESFPLLPVRLSSNFRTDPALVSSLNNAFDRIFATPDGSGIKFSPADSARDPRTGPDKRLELHLEFSPQARYGYSSNPDAIRRRLETAAQREQARTTQTGNVVALIRSHLDRIEAARKNGQKYRIAILGRARTALAPIATALREAGIPFRAVELESLGDRPEILDAASLARAFLNPEDRVAWLGVLRAPWCGFTLAELHAIAGTDDPSHLVLPIPHLLRDRLHLLPADARPAAQRVLSALASVPHLRATHPTASAGTLYQQIWRILGGDRCVDASGLANLDLFWKAFDNLPEGEQDLVSPALNSILEDLCALPDPASGSDCGVQLMTIHKSKGLEFEVVIVPDLHARAGRSKSELLSWLERGIEESDDDSSDLTEFLVAPLQFKGADRGKAKQWVDRLRRQRESQETRRILYVAATRAREELHLFAQPSYKSENDGSRSLLDPSDCLLATAWAAFGDEIRARFDEWNAAHQNAQPIVELTLDRLAASGENVIVMPSPAPATILRRLPPAFLSGSQSVPSVASPEDVIGLSDSEPYQRHEGGLQSRALGNAVHRLLEQLARLRTTLSWDNARVALEKSRPRLLSAVRSTGLSLADAETITTQAFDIALRASLDPYGQWILSPHADAASESGWAGIVNGNLRLVRVDRIFRAGIEPLQTGENALWIIDYKTAHSENLDPTTALATFRATFEPQLQVYADLLRGLHAPGVQLRAGLYYPRMTLFDWWEI